MSAQILHFPALKAPHDELHALMTIGRKLADQPGNDIMLDYWLDRMNAWEARG